MWKRLESAACRRRVSVRLPLAGARPVPEVDVSASAVVSRSISASSSSERPRLSSASTFRSSCSTEEAPQGAFSCRTPFWNCAWLDFGTPKVANCGVLASALGKTLWRNHFFLISLYGLLQAGSKMRQPGIAAVIRLMRLTKEWNQEELGSKTGIKSSDISLLESGRRNPTLETLQRLAEAFGVDCFEMVKLADEFESKVKLMEGRPSKS